MGPGRCRSGHFGASFALWFHSDFSTKTRFCLGEVNLLYSLTALQCVKSTRVKFATILINFHILYTIGYWRLAKYSGLIVNASFYITASAIKILNSKKLCQNWTAIFS